MLNDATIGELFRELAQVEREIRACDPLFVSVGSDSALSPQLLELAAEEQRICDELARRRAGLRTQLESRRLTMRMPTSSTVPDGPCPATTAVCNELRPASSLTRVPWQARSASPRTGGITEKSPLGHSV